MYYCVYCAFLLLVKYGPVAHLVERLICTEEAGGSSPLGSTKRNIVGIKKFAQMLK